MDSRTVEGYNKLLIFSDNRKINIYYTLTTANGSERVPFVGGAGGKILNVAFIFKSEPYIEKFLRIAPKKHTAFRSCDKSQRGTPL